MKTNIKYLMIPINICVIQHLTRNKKTIANFLPTNTVCNSLTNSLNLLLYT